VSSSRFWAAALAAGLAAGLLSWLGGEAVYGLFDPPSELVNSVNLARSSELAAAQMIALIKNAIAAFRVLGAVLGMVMGSAGGAARRSLRAGAIAAAFGLVVGGALGFGMSLVLVPVAARDLVMLYESLGFALLIHGGIWSVLGAAGGLAFGAGLGSRSLALRAAVGGLAGALLGTLIYDLLGAVIAPLAGTGAPLSTSLGMRLLARVCVCVPATLGAAAASAQQQRC
jgi:hypothetical protein